MRSCHMTHHGALSGMKICPPGSLRDTALPVRPSQNHNHTGIVAALRRPEEKYLLPSLTPAILPLEDVNRQVIDDKHLCV